jgi:hypothetical protein
LNQNLKTILFFSAQPKIILAHLSFFLSAPAQVAFGSPGRSGPAHLQESSSSSARAATTHPVGVAAPCAAACRTLLRAREAELKSYPTTFPLPNEPTLHRVPFIFETADFKAHSPATVKLLRLAASPPVQPYKRPLCLGHSPPRPKPLQPSSLPAPSLLSLRANHCRHHIPITGLPPAPHRPPSPTVGTPEASPSFSPTAGELPLTGAAPSPCSGEPFGRRHLWSIMDP